MIDFPTFLKMVTIQPQFVDISPEITCDDDVRSWGDDRFWSVPVARRPLPARWSPRLLHINNLPLDHYSLSNTQPLYLHPNPIPILLHINNLPPDHYSPLVSFSCCPEEHPDDYEDNAFVCLTSPLDNLLHA